MGFYKIFLTFYSGRLQFFLQRDELPDEFKTLPAVEADSVRAG